MAKRKILLTGAAGQLGMDVVVAGEARDDVDVIPLDRAALDITDQVAVAAALASAKPDVVLHGAAYTAVDACESDEATADLVNRVGTQNLVAAAGRARVIGISTDYVFDGTKTGPYVESDEPQPASAYGRTKLAAEQALRPDDLVVRTSWVCGVNGNNMVKTILRVAEQHETLTFVDDQIGKPTFTHDMAEALLDLAVRDDSGIMHLTNEGPVSWYEFCRDVMRAADLDPNRVRPCRTDELDPPRPAARPANSVLANTRFGDLGLPLLRDYRQPLAETVRQLISG